MEGEMDILYGETGCGCEGELEGCGRRNGGV